MAGAAPGTADRAGGNHAALGLYESLDFTAHGHEPAALQVDGRYIDETLMIRLLAT